MPTFAAPVDLLGSELRNFVVQNLPIDPASFATPGRLFYNSATQMLRFRNDTDFVDLATTSSLGALAALDEVTTAEILDGTILDVDINDTAGIALSKLAKIPAMQLLGNDSGSLGTPREIGPATVMQLLSGTAATSFYFNGHMVAGLGEPTVADAAATKAYVDASRGGFSLKDPVRAGSTGNVTLSGVQTVDGISLVDGDRVLVKDQTAAEENGIWVVASGVWARADDADEDSEVSSGMALWVSEGDDNAGLRYVLTTPDPITVGTTPLVFTLDSAPGGSGSMVGTPDRITVTGNAIDIAANYAGQSSIDTVGLVTTGTWMGTPVDIAYGGTGATSPSDAMDALGGVRSYAMSIGDGTSTEFTISHFLNMCWDKPFVQVIDTFNNNSVVYADVSFEDPKKVKIKLTNPPDSYQYSVILIG
jgi:hypothetical protein